MKAEFDKKDSFPNEKEAFSETSSFNLPVEGLPAASLYETTHAQQSTPVMVVMTTVMLEMMS